VCRQAYIVLWDIGLSALQALLTEAGLIAARQRI
jgi:hypothetical protein